MISSAVLSVCALARSPDPHRALNRKAKAETHRPVLLQLLLTAFFNLLWLKKFEVRVR